jgi:pSer/pThr/pTyr-binding forkhead associated (FHA) protein
MRINDPNGTVSRLHLKVSLVGWQVEVSDLGSANGSVLQAPGKERTLAPFEPTAIEPGARIGIGHRSMQYVAYQGA